MKRLKDLLVLQLFQNKGPFFLPIFTGTLWEWFRFRIKFGKPKFHIQEKTVCFTTLELEQNEMDRKFLQLSQNFTNNSLLIDVFCTSSKPKIVLQVLQIKRKMILCSVVFTIRPNWRNYESLSYYISLGPGEWISI